MTERILCVILLNLTEIYTCVCHLQLFNMFYGLVKQRRKLGAFMSMNSYLGSILQSVVCLKLTPAVNICLKPPKMPLSKKIT